MTDSGFHEDQRRFMEELIIRFERAFQRVDRSIAENTRSLEAMRHEIEDHRGEFVTEMRAQRQALFAILDRLDGNGGTAPAA